MIIKTADGIQSWIMVYFRSSFQSAADFPWIDAPQKYFADVVHQVPPK